MALDFNKLTMGEISLLEDCTGERFAAGMSETPSVKMLMGMAMIAKRREQMSAGERPSFSWADVEAITFDDAMDLIGDDSDPKETPTITEG